MATNTYFVEGMTCDHCVRAVRQELSAIQGVSEVDVDLGSGRVDIKSEQPVASDAVRTAVEEAGYSVR